MLKAGDIVFTKSNSLLSRISNLVQTGKFNQIVPSHVAIVSHIYANKVVLIESSYSGVRIVDLDIYRKGMIWFRRMKDPRDIQKGLVWCNGQIGTRYDFMQIVGLFFRSFLRILGKKAYQKSKIVKNLLDSKTKFICSEFVEQYASITGLRLWKNDISHVTPFDLFRSLLLKEVSE